MYKYLYSLSSTSVQALAELSKVKYVVLLCEGH